MRRAGNSIGMVLVVFGLIGALCLTFTVVFPPGGGQENRRPGAAETDAEPIAPPSTGEQQKIAATRADLREQAAEELAELVRQRNWSAAWIFARTRRIKEIRLGNEWASIVQAIDQLHSIKPTDRRSRAQRAIDLEALEGLLLRVRPLSAYRDSMRCIGQMFADSVDPEAVKRLARILTKGVCRQSSPMDREAGYELVGSFLESAALDGQFMERSRLACMLIAHLSTVQGCECLIRLMHEGSTHWRCIGLVKNEKCAELLFQEFERSEGPEELQILAGSVAACGEEGKGLLRGILAMSPGRRQSARGNLIGPALLELTRHLSSAEDLEAIANAIQRDPVLAKSVTTVLRHERIDRKAAAAAIETFIERHPETPQAKNLREVLEEWRSRDESR